MERHAGTERTGEFAGPSHQFVAHQVVADQGDPAGHAVVPGRQLDRCALPVDDLIDGSGVHALRALSSVAHDEHRLPKGGGLLLDPTRVGEHDAAGAHEGDKGAIGLGRQ